MNNYNISNFSQTLYQNILSKMLEKIFDKLEMFGAILIEINKSWLDKNLNLVVLCNIIQS